MRKHLFVAAAALLLAACSGPTQLAGIQGSGAAVAYGPITGFGSIFVNGVEYATSSAQIAASWHSSGRPTTWPRKSASRPSCNSARGEA